jgi:hypothetical protein
LKIEVVKFVGEGVNASVYLFVLGQQEIQRYLFQVSGKQAIWVKCIDIERRKIDCLRFVILPLLAPGFQGFFFDAAINSTNEANKAGGMHH